ncbi:YugN family protein [Planococcus shenhongbingii]|uniref:YugN family protein n=1 Tax=Planococcus shenhongbingii TaxID=3058398 RepID=A0ABT8N8V0_9BACL|nr:MULTISPECIES: YugN family protein [unclassified Planococcus (in: firmicutes)]MDN7244296.1 YugN family protein [Planococcus sp. N017]WKA57465.1 YugN family protein [Planococcus sp. N016]
MYFENTGLENIRVDFTLLDDIMSRHGLTKEGQWDYERVTYDRKFIVREGTYYLRVFGFAVAGDIDAGDAVVKLMKPVVGKHYYPHGVEYGEDEHFPEHLVKSCAEVLKAIKTEIAAFEIKA